MRCLLYISLIVLPLQSFAQMHKVLTVEANIAFENENFSEADSLYTLALESDPEYLPAKYNKGITAFKLSHWNESLELWKQLSQSTIDSVRAHSFYHTGNCKLMQWIQMEADIAQISIQIDDLDLNSISDIEDKMAAFLLRDSLIVNRGELLKQKEVTLESSIEDFKNCLRITPSDDDARYNLIYTMSLRPIKESAKEKEGQKSPSDQSKIPEAVAKSEKRAIELIQENKFGEALKELKTTKQNYPEQSGKLDGLIQKLEVINEIMNR